MRLLPLSIFVATIMISNGYCLAQGIIGGNQNGLGANGYLPKPTGSTNSAGHGLTSPVVTSLGMPGYDFQLVEISGQPVKVVIDSQVPVVVPLSKSSSTLPVVPQTGPGFLASFEVDNNSSFDRTFEFVDQYYANIKIIFTVFDNNGTAVWQSYATEVDIPPLATKVDLTLPAHGTWHKCVFVPLHHADLSLLDPGQYTLQAEVIGSPGYLASAPFQVSTLVGGPIIHPTVAGK